MWEDGYAEELHVEREATRPLPDWHEEEWEDSGEDNFFDLAWEHHKREKAERRRQAALAGNYGEVSRVAALAGLQSLGKASPDAAARRLHRAGELLEELEPEHQDDAYRYLRSQATTALRATWGDWGAVEDFVRAHLPEPLGERSPFQAGGLRDVDVLTLEPPAILVEGLIPQGEVGIVTGDSGTGKSWLMAELAGGVAFGGSWLGREVQNTGHVRLFLPEGRVSFPGRLAGVLMARGLLEPGARRPDLSAAIEGRISITDGHTVLNDPRLEEHLRADIEAHGTKLVVFDTLNRSLGDGQDENDANDAKGVMNMLHRLAADTGCTFLLVHHPPHGENRERGSRVWRDAPDFRYLIYGTDRDVRAGRPVTLWNVKQRNVPPADSIGYRLRERVVEYDGEEGTTCTVELAAVATEVPLADRIRWFVDANPGLPKSRVISNVTGDDKKVSAEIDRLLTEGKLQNENEGSSGPWALHVAGEWETHEAPDLSDLTEGSGAEDA